MLMATAPDDAQSEAYPGDTNKCVPCKNDGSKEEAEYYCKQCQDKFCAACEASHKTFKITRNHEVVSLTDMKKELENTNDGSNKAPCRCGKNDAEFYCEVHIDVFCSECKWKKHGRCDAMLLEKTVMELGEDFDKSTVQIAEDMKSKLMKLRQMHEQYHDKLLSTIKRASEEIERLIGRVTRIGENTLEYLRESSDSCVHIIEQNIASCDISLMALDTGRQAYQNVKESDDRYKRFVEYLKLKQVCFNLDRMEIIDDKMDKTYLTPHLSFLIYEDVARLFENDSCVLGDIYHNFFGPATKNFTPSMKIMSTRQVKLKANRRYTKPPWLVSTVFLPSGNLVICDRNDRCLTMFDPGLRLVSHKELRDDPLDCCILDDNTVAVCLYNHNFVCKIQLFEIDGNYIKYSQPSFNLPTKSLDEACVAIASDGQSIYALCSIRRYVTSASARILVIDKNGKTKKEIGYVGLEKKIAARLSTQNGNFSVSYRDDSGESEVWCFNERGQNKSKFSNAELKGAAGMYVFKDGSVLVCYEKSNKVCLVDQDGSRSKEIISSDIVTAPNSVCFRECDGTLVVSMKDADHLLVCRMGY